MAIQELLKLSKDYYSDRAPKEIEQNRKGTFFITLMHDGQAVDDAEISFRLKRHDYDFGCNIFMLDQYESAETNEQYLSLWKKLLTRRWCRCIGRAPNRNRVFFAMMQTPPTTCIVVRLQHV